jgi:hypothetical protein
MNPTHQHDYQWAGIMGGMSLYQLWLAIYSASPPWQVVPPLLFGAAAIWNAYTNHRNSRARTTTAAPAPGPAPTSQDEDR